MTNEVKFIISTQNVTLETRNAHKRIVRSHVTSQRYKKKRQDAVREHERLKQAVEHAISSPIRSPRGHRASLDHGIASNHSQSQDYSLGDSDKVLLPLDDNPILKTAGDQESAASIDELRLEEDGGKLIRLEPPPSPLTYVGNGLSDPFERLPPFVVPQMGKHLFYCKSPVSNSPIHVSALTYLADVNVMMPEMHPSYTTNLVRRTYGCRSWAGGDEIILNVIATYSATSRAMASGDLVRTGLSNTRGSGFHESTMERLYFKTRTLKLINRNLTRWGQMIADETIRGITGLILIEAFTGSLDEAAAHMRGLQRLVALHYKASPMPYATAERITRAAVKLASLSRSKPIVPFTMTFDFPLPLPSISHMLPLLGTRLISKWHDISPSRDLVSVFYDMATMTRYTEAVYDWIFPYTEDDSYFEFIEFRNLQIEHSLLSHESANQLEECVRMASILFLNTSLTRAYPNASAIIHNNVEALQDILVLQRENGKNLTSTWAGKEEALFWTLFIGSHCSYGQSEELFFGEALQETASVINLSSFDDMRTLLSSFFFVDRVYLDTLKRISKQMYQ